MRATYKILTLLAPLMLKAGTIDPCPLARWGTKEPSNTYLLGEVIFLKPLVKQLVQVSESSYSYFQNRFKPGVRLTLGRNTSYDGWDSALSYTGWRYRHINESLFATTTFNVQGPLCYVYALDQANLDLGRFCQVSKHLILRPHTGLRALWFRQKGTLDDHISRLKSSLYGLQGGLDMAWTFPHQLSLYARAGFTTLAAHQKAFYEINTTIISQTSDPAIYLVNGLDCSLGIQWDINFADDSYHFALSAGYEQHTLIKINTPSNLTITNDLMNTPDFNLQGIALGARLDF